MCLLVVFCQLTFADLLGRPDEREPVLLVQLDPQLAARASGRSPGSRTSRSRSQPRRPRRRSSRRRSSPPRRAPRRARSPRAGRRRGRAGRSCAPGSGRSSRSAARAGAAPPASSVRANDRVRVADRDRGQLDALAVDLDRLDLADLDVADGHRDRPVVREPSRGTLRPPAEIVTRSAPARRSEPGRRDPAAVARRTPPRSRRGSRSRSRPPSPSAATTSSTPSEPMP